MSVLQGRLRAPTIRVSRGRATVPTGATYEPRRGCVGKDFRTSRPGNEDIHRSRRLFQEALEYEQRQDWAAALERMLEVGLIKLTPQVRIHIALYEEKLGADAALRAYQDVLSRSDELGWGLKCKLEEMARELESGMGGNKRRFRWVAGPRVPGR
jgi:hypothetical protein